MEAEKVPCVGIVSLGCPKALVDSERILSCLRSEGYAFSGSYADADVVIVNTCGFLDSAREESFEAIAEAMEGNGRVIVTGCLGSADAEGIRKRHPDILAVTGAHQYEAVVDAVHAAVKPPHSPRGELLPPGGIKLTPRHYAYLKIAEGCHNSCSYCIIPKLRGPLVSRPVGEVLREAEKLVSAGVRELLVVAQDVAAYGLDIRHAKGTWRGREYPASMLGLSEGLAELGVWVRLHYVYPYPNVDEVIPLMAAGKILPYLDIPFQHASPRVLKAMKRPGDTEKLLERIRAWRKICPDITLRSSFIVGFPGETEEDFQMLLDWLREARLDRVGCFKYEDVEGVASTALPDKVPQEVIEERWHRFMQVQQEISAEILAAKVGKTLPVIVDGKCEGGYVARTKGDAPEIDGVVLLKTRKKLASGDLVNALITEADDYDLVAKLA
ncbi:MAG TPA: 30S ribosomal protein S12 methylthiotransferase RimO [Rhodospirillaceae bacterium]|nr:MAG: ribosomal protein S12 methylthiotransferase [Alphaproteobacteria bacterium GWF2_58_20]HAU28885.1 30S ribosomal protein S12 methylthiotransferase RimO [Rhodospirillaceae bacterium]